MATQQKKGFVARMLEGKERSEEYARSTLPTNRWQLFFDIFKGNFGKLVKINLLMLLFFLPTIAVLFFRYVMSESTGLTYPFGSNLGVGYPAAPDLQGLSEILTFYNDITVNLLLVVSMFIASVGLSGGMYVIRNMVWTEGIFVSNDFWRGVKLNYKNALQTTLFFTIVYFLCSTLENTAHLSLAAGNLTNGQTIWLKISLGVNYLMLTLASMMAFWMVAQGVNYKLSFTQLFKNSFLMTIGTLPQTIFFGFLALLPYLLFAIGGQLFLMIAIMILIFFGFSYSLLVWIDFSQWVFDKYINPKIEGAKTNRGIYSKDGTSAVTGDSSEAELEYRRTLVAQGRSRLAAQPIKPIDDSLQVYELPQAFTREDLQKLRESKNNIAEDTAQYAEEHKNDLRYVEYNEQFDNLEKSLQEADEAKNKKKRRKPRILDD